MDTVVALILEQKFYVGLALLVFLALLALTCKTLRAQLKKGLIFLLLVIGLGGAYYFFTGKSPSAILSDINSFFNEPAVKKEPSHRYYKDPVERYGDQIK
ncbi:MAG: hypothetical protein KJ804_13815 [Proteobacteria bacterium]|nr:hypothetical protein [Pseudomonadota bacterium]MBU1059386.1 hypothetical protein [Pseudomonadota bacterium]